MRRHIIGVMISPHYGVHCSDWYDRYERKFHGNNRSLTEVPMGIPAEVWHIYLQDNEISTIPSGIFSNYSKCYRLNLDNNLLTELQSGMFDGLVSLTGLVSLKRLFLMSNQTSEFRVMPSVP